MNVLFAVWELDPFIKVGGLGDVARSLPKALGDFGIDIRVIIPFYQALKLGRSKKKLIARYKVKYAEAIQTVEVFHVTHPSIQRPVYILRNKKYLDIPKFPDTYAFFSMAIVVLLAQNILDWKPDIIHCNDLHTGLIPLLVKEHKLPIKTMLTIHNLAYQGKTSLDILGKIGLTKDKCQVVQWEIKSNQINFLLEGIIHADVITTVSPEYSKEILTEKFGEGLEDIVRGKEGRIFGVLNGIDDHWRNKLHIRHVKYPYKGKENSWEVSKKQNKAFLQKKLRLQINPSIPLFAFIGRFDPWQKGIDILHKMLRSIDVENYEFVILGRGNVDWEERFKWLSTFYPKHINCNFVFSEILANQIYAASDFIVIPSKFEPCGLIQMIAMGYGTLPIAHKTGGLRDSIKPGYNGFLFETYDAKALQDAVEKAVDIWKNHKDTYREMVEHALAADFSWNKSAKEYITLYEQLLHNS